MARHSLAIQLLALSLSVLVVVVGLPRAAAAAPEGTVFLRNGGRIHGELMEVVPDEYVTVRLADGSVRKIDWDQVLRVDEKPAAPPPAASPGPPRPAEPPVTAAVVVRSTKDGVTIGEVTGHALFAVTTPQGAGMARGVAWRNICMAPCRFRIDPGLHELIATGPGYRNRVAQFDLGPGVNKLVVKPGSAGLWIGGLILGSLGLTAVITGATFMAYRPNDYNWSTGESTKPGIPGWSIATLVLGLLAIAGGVGMMVGGTTSFDRDVEPPRQ